MSTAVLGEAATLSAAIGSMCLMPAAKWLETRVQQIMTPEQVAAYLQLNTDTIYRLIRSRELPAAKIGRAYRIPKEEVDAFLVSHSTSPQLRSALFRRVLAVAEQNPGVNSDDVLEELEAWDEEQQARRATTPR